VPKIEAPSEKPFGSQWPWDRNFQSLFGNHSRATSSSMNSCHTSKRQRRWAVAYASDKITNTEFHSPCGAVMKEPYLEVTFRHGRPWRRTTTCRAERTRGVSEAVLGGRVEPGLVIDFVADRQAIGIEITTPTKVSLAALNAGLRELGHAPASPVDLAPVTQPERARFSARKASCAPYGGPGSHPGSSTQTLAPHMRI
jgi:hypothetical protein